MLKIDAYAIRARSRIPACKSTTLVTLLLLAAPILADPFANAQSSLSGRPSAPSISQAISGDGAVTLTWNAPSFGVVGAAFSVYRGAAPGAEAATPIVSGLTALTYKDKGLADGVPEYYTVVASNPKGSSAPSPEVMGVPYAAPTGLTTIPGDVEVLLTWAPLAGASTNGGGYIVWRSLTPGGPYTQVTTTLISGGPAYLDTVGGHGLDIGATYYYVVTYLDKYGNVSPKSSEVSAATAAAGGVWSLSVSPSDTSSGSTSDPNASSDGAAHLSTGTVFATVAGPQSAAANEAATALIGGTCTAIWHPDTPGALPGLYVVVEDRTGNIYGEIAGEFSGDASVAIAGGPSLETRDPASATQIASLPKLTETLDESTPGVVAMTVTATDHTRKVTGQAPQSIHSYTENLSVSSQTVHVFTPEFFEANYSTSPHVFLSFPLPETSIAALAAAGEGTPAGDACSAWGEVTDEYSKFKVDER